MARRLESKRCKYPGLTDQLVMAMKISTKRWTVETVDRTINIALERLSHCIRHGLEVSIPRGHR